MTTTTKVAASKRATNDKGDGLGDLLSQQVAKAATKAVDRDLDRGFSHVEVCCHDAVGDQVLGASQVALQSGEERNAQERRNQPVDGHGRHRRVFRLRGPGVWSLSPRLGERGSQGTNL